MFDVFEIYFEVKKYEHEAPKRNDFIFCKTIDLSLQQNILRYVVIYLKKVDVLCCLIGFCLIT